MKIFSLIFILLFVIPFVYAATGSSTNFDSDSKVDSGVASDSNSTSFTNRFFAGVHTVGQYIVSTLSGRFGVLSNSDSDEPTLLNSSGCGNLNVANSIYTLNASVNSSGTCFTILANDVTLDCNGHSINYSQSVVGYGVTTNGYNFTTIKNCVITQGNRSRSNSYGILIRNQVNSTVRNNNITTYGPTSSNALNYAVYMNNVNNSRVRLNNIETYGLGSHSVYFYGSDNVLSEGNVISLYGNNAYGVYVYRSKSSDMLDYVYYNRIFTNGSRSMGIYVHSLKDSQINFNNITNNGTISTGIYADRTNESSFNYNNINNYGDQSYGLRVSSYAHRNNISGNDLSLLGLGNQGIYLASEAHNNNIINNSVNSYRYAISLARGGSNNIYNNIFNTTTTQIFSFTNSIDYSNILNTTKSLSENIIGREYIGGNYWINSLGTGFSQTCADYDLDGICDLTYTLNTYNKDYLPLVNADNVPPYVSILTPENESYVNGRVIVIANASDNSKVSSVSFQYSNSTVSWTNITGCYLNVPNYLGNYRCYWYTTSFSNDSNGYDIRAVVYDGQGNDASDVRRYIIDRTRPVIYELNVNYPAGQTSLRDGQILNLETTVTDSPYIAAGISNVQTNLVYVNSSSWSNLFLTSGSLASDMNSTWGKNVVVSNGYTGTRSVGMRVYDAAVPTNNSATGNWIIRFDNTPPSYSGLNSDNGLYNNSLALFEIIVSDNYQLDSYVFSDNSSGVWENSSVYYISGTNQYINYEKIVYSGDYGYKFYVFDDAGNMLESEEKSINVLGPSPTPEIYLLYPTPSLILNSSLVSFNYTYTDLTMNNCSLILDSVVNETMINPVISNILTFSKSLVEGDHSWYISCFVEEEEAGENITKEYTSDGIYSFTIDSVNPTINIVSPEATSYSESDLTFNLTTSEDISNCYYSLDGGLDSIMNSENLTSFYYEYSGLTQGSHFVNFSCYDNANNIGVNSVIFNIAFLNSSIEIVSPLNNEEIVRGSNIVDGEDVLDFVSDYKNLIARVYDGSNNGLEGASCYFYLDDVTVGSSYSNSSGYCNLSLYKPDYSIGTHEIFVNYSYIVENVNGLINNSYANMSLARYVTTLAMSNLRDNGKYYDGDEAVLDISIRKSNGTLTDEYYDIEYLSASAKNSAGIVRGTTVYPENITRNNVGRYTTNVTVDYGPGSDAFVKWEVYLSQDDFLSYVGSALHADEDVCSADFGEWSSWSTCSSGTQTRTRVDSSGCSEVESQSCTEEDEEEDDGGGGTSCSDQCSSSSESYSCLNENTLGTRTCGNYDSDSCSEWGSWESSSCGVGQVCQNAQCVDIICEENWQCSEWSECLNGFQTRICSDSNLCGTTLEKPIDRRSCDICLENWRCDYTICQEGDVYSYPYNCVDINGCGTIEDKPYDSEECGSIVQQYTPKVKGTYCSPRWKCSDWSVCDASYNVNDLLNSVDNVKGVNNRVCIDMTGCALDVEEYGSCELGLEIEARVSQWCYEDYVEIYNVNTGELVSRIKESEIESLSNFTRLDITFTSNNYEGYCSYCSDGVKNYDEEDVDCGGRYCQECFNIYNVFDWAFWIVVGSWISFGFLLIVLLRREEEEREESGRHGLLESVREEAKDVITSVRITPRREKEIEAEIELFFKKIFFSSKRRPAVQRREVVHEVVSYEREGPSERDLLIQRLKRKLEGWKKEGYHGTAMLEAKIRKLESKKRSFISRIVTKYKERRERNRVERERISRLNNLKEKNVVEPRKRNTLKKMFSLFKSKRVSLKDNEKKNVLKNERLEIKRKEKERKVREKERKVIEKERKRLIKKKVKVVKAEIRKRKFLSLMRKLKLWRKQGYYGTAELEEELRRLKKQM